MSEAAVSNQAVNIENEEVLIEFRMIEWKEILSLFVVTLVKLYYTEEQLSAAVLNQTLSFPNAICFIKMKNNQIGRVEFYFKRPMKKKK